MKGRNYSDFSYWREIFFGDRFHFFIFFDSIPKFNTEIVW